MNNKSKGYQPQISLNKKDSQEKRFAQSQSNSQNLIDFNFNGTNQSKTPEATTHLAKTDLISFTAGNEVSTINSKKQSEFNFINNRKTNSTQNIHTNLHSSNLIDVNSNNIPTNLKTLNDNLNKLYSNNEQQTQNSADINSNNGFSPYNSNNQQPNINIQNTYYQFYDNSMNNQMGTNMNNGIYSGYNPNRNNNNPNLFYNNGYNNTNNNQNGFNNYNAMNNCPNYSDGTPKNNYNHKSSFNGNYQRNMSYNDYTFGLTPTVGVNNNYYLNLTDEKDRKTKNEDPFKNLVSFK
jgi:hypothetical protein